MSTERFPDPTEFEARWRAAANADPGHATYPEAVPGYRAQRTPRGRTRPAEGPRKRRPDLDALRAAEPVIRMDHGTGGMIVQWVKPEGDDVPPADAPVTVDEIQDRHERHNALTDAIRQAAAKPGTAVQSPYGAVVVPRRWWDPRGWWRR